MIGGQKNSKDLPETMSRAGSCCSQESYEQVFPPGAGSSGLKPHSVFRSCCMKYNAPGERLVKIVLDLPNIMVLDLPNITEASEPLLERFPLLFAGRLGVDLSITVNDRIGSLGKGP